eukprot:COSAG03_NODE_10293_length_660_cov_0.625668_1_plen_143_part_10
MELTEEDQAVLDADIEGTDEGLLKSEADHSATVKKFRYIAEGLMEKVEKELNPTSMRAAKAKTFFTETLEDLTYARVALALEPHLVSKIEEVRYLAPGADIDVAMPRQIRNILQTATDNFVEGKVREQVQMVVAAAMKQADKA